MMKRLTALWMGIVILWLAGIAVADGPVPKSAVLVEFDDDVYIIDFLPLADGRRYMAAMRIPVRLRRKTPRA